MAKKVTKKQASKKEAPKKEAPKKKTPKKKTPKKIGGPAFDAEKLRRDVLEAARAALADIRAKAGDDPLYAFALYSDDDAGTIIPAANTERGLASKAKYYGDRVELQYLRWGTAEWEYEGRPGANHFNSICDRLLSLAMSDAVPRGKGFVAHRWHVYEVAIKALEDLDREGVFGVGKARQEMTVFCTISDSNDARRLERESARRLNPPAVFRRFMKR